MRLPLRPRATLAGCALAASTFAGALVAPLPAAPSVALAYDDGRCPATPPVPKEHLQTPWSVSIVNTATSPPEIDLFFDKGAADGVKVGDVVYAVDCRGYVLPRTLATIASSSKSGSSATFVMERSALPRTSFFVIDVTHGVVGAPSIAGAPGVGATSPATKGPTIAHYAPGALSTSSPRAAIGRQLQLGSTGYVVNPREERIQATFLVDEWTPTGSNLRVTPSPWARTGTDTSSWLIVYPTVCTFPQAAPDPKKKVPPGHVYPNITRIDPTPDKKFLVTFDKGARDGIVAGSKVYFVDRGAVDATVPISIEKIDATSVTVLSPYNRSGLAGKVLFQIAQCR